MLGPSARQRPRRFRTAEDYISAQTRRQAWRRIRQGKSKGGRRRKLHARRPESFCRHQFRVRRQRIVCAFGRGCVLRAASLSRHRDSGPRWAAHSPWYWAIGADLDPASCRYPAGDALSSRHASRVSATGHVLSTAVRLCPSRRCRRHVPLIALFRSPPGLLRGSRQAPLQRTNE